MSSHSNRADSCDVGEAAKLLDFRSPPPDHRLPTLSVYTHKLVDINKGLELHLSTVEQGHSLAASSGEVIFASYLSRQLGRLFTTTEPETIRGSQADWTRVALFQNSLARMSDDDIYTMNESVMRIPKVDMDLIASGRPRQFLTPWPPASDVQKELKVLDATITDLADLMKVLSSCK